MIIGQVPMLPQKWLEILLVDVSIIPIIYFFEGFAIVELFWAVDRLSLFFQDTVQSYFFFKQLGHWSFNSRTQRLPRWYYEVRSHGNLRSQVGIVDRHDNLQEVVVIHHSFAFCCEVLYYVIAIGFICFIDFVLSQKFENVHAGHSTVLVLIHSLKGRVWLKLWEARQYLPCYFDMLLSLFESEKKLLEQ